MTICLEKSLNPKDVIGGRYGEWLLEFTNFEKSEVLSKLEIFLLKL